jgi:hypothetical protein
VANASLHDKPDSEACGHRRLWSRTTQANTQPETTFAQPGGFKGQKKAVFLSWGIQSGTTAIDFRREFFMSNSGTLAGFDVLSHSFNLGRTRRCLRYVAAVGLHAITVFAATASYAALIATDHFLGASPGDPAIGQYSTTATVNQLRRSTTAGAGQNPTIAGYSGAWTGNVTSGSLAVAQWTAEASPLGSTLPYEQGGRARFAGADNVQRRVQRSLDPYTTSNVYYISLLSQVLTGDADGDGFVGIGFTNTGATVGEADANVVSGSGLRGILIGPAGAGPTDPLKTNYVVRHVGSTGSVQNDIILADIPQNQPGTTSPYVRYTIAKIDFNDQPTNPAGNSKLTIWQDPTDISSEAAASLSVTPLEFRTFALTTASDITHMTFTGVDYSKAASFDEPRFATTWDDVASVPEPAAAMLVGTAALLFAAARRRRA